jgi:hypothetical protein
MNTLPILPLFVASTSPRVTIADTPQTRLSRITHQTIADELRARAVDVGTAGDFFAEIVYVSDASSNA